MNASDIKALLILADGFEEIEAVSSIDILRRAHINTIVASLKNREVRGSHGVIITSDVKLEDVKDDNFDVLILPGGGVGADNLAASAEVRSVIISMNKNGKVIAAICASPAVVLSPTGILKNKAATCYPGMRSNFDKTTTYKKDPVVVDGNIITGNGVGGAIEFALTIVSALRGKEAAEKVAKEILVK